jgi:glutamate racemase
MNKTSNPIGVFDSGVGGTSVWKEIITMLPFEDTLYLADSKHAPYGEKSKDEIIALSEKNTEFLLEKNAKLIVVACNTATTNAIKHLRQKYEVPFVGIEPAIKPAALNSKHKAVGILATKGTLSSELFDETKGKFAKDIKVIEQIGHGLVELIESNRLNASQTQVLLKRYLQPMIAEHIDYLILGCTHYPYLIPQIKNLVPEYVKIIDSGEAVARQTKNLLMQHNLLNPANILGIHELYSTGGVEVLKILTKEVKNAIVYSI